MGAEWRRVCVSMAGLKQSETICENTVGHDVNAFFRNSNEMYMTCRGAILVVDSSLLEPCSIPLPGVDGTLHNAFDTFWYLNFGFLESRNSICLLKKLLGRDSILAYGRRRLFFTIIASSHFVRFRSVFGHFNRSAFHVNRWLLGFVLLWIGFVLTQDFLVSGSRTQLPLWRAML